MRVAVVDCLISSSPAVACDALSTPVTLGHSHNSGASSQGSTQTYNGTDGDQTRTLAGQPIFHARKAVVDGGPVHKCPVCSVQLRIFANPLVCSCCNSEVHKKCSGLTKAEQRAFIEAGSWVCDDCSGNNSIAPPAPAQIPASAVSENPLNFCKRNSLLFVH